MKSVWFSKYYVYITSEGLGYWDYMATEDKHKPQLFPARQHVMNFTTDDSKMFALRKGLEHNSEFVALMAASNLMTDIYMEEEESQQLCEPSPSSMKFKRALKFPRASPSTQVFVAWFLRYSKEQGT